MGEIAKSFTKPLKKERDTFPTPNPPTADSEWFDYFKYKNDDISLLFINSNTSKEKTGYFIVSDQKGTLYPILNIAEEDKKDNSNLDTIELDKELNEFFDKDKTYMELNELVKLKNSGSYQDIFFEKYQLLLFSTPITNYEDVKKIISIFWTLKGRLISDRLPPKKIKKIIKNESSKLNKKLDKKEIEELVNGFYTWVGIKS